jgi:starvation-inducible DNA-binding protein
MKIPSDLTEKARKTIAQAINPLIADAFALYVKTKNFHWHLHSPHFRDYHKLFDEQAAQILETIDTLAERLRKLDQPAITSIGHIHRLQKVKDEDQTNLPAEAMLRMLMEDNQAHTARMRKAHDICQKQSDVATTSILEIFIDEAERRAWFLSSSL